MISCVWGSPNIVHVSSHTPAYRRPQIWVSFPCGKGEDREGEQLLISHQDDKDQSLCSSPTLTYWVLFAGFWPQGDDVGALERHNGGWAIETSESGRDTCQQRPPAPSAALPNTGWRMTKRLSRDSMETRARKEAERKETTVYNNTI